MLFDRDRLAGRPDERIVAVGATTAPQPVSYVIHSGHRGRE